MSIMLYWAEGSKSKEHNISQGFIFSNSAPKMIKLMLVWIQTCLKVEIERIKLEIYVHERYKGKTDMLISYWSSTTGFLPSKFGKIYFKREKIRIRRKNIGSNYWGQLRIKIRRSTNINRYITACINEICRYCGVV